MRTADTIYNFSPVVILSFLRNLAMLYPARNTVETKNTNPEMFVEYITSIIMAINSIMNDEILYIFINLFFINSPINQDRNATLGVYAYIVLRFVPNKVTVL